MSDQILTPQQNQVLALIATGSTLSAAAEAAGIHRNTIANWRRTQPGFTEEFHEAQIEQTMHWRDQMQSLGALAVDALRAVLADEKATPSTRLKAALVVLNCITKPAQKAEIAAQPCTTDPQPTENKQRSDTPTAPAKSGFVPSTPGSIRQMPVFVGPLAEFKRKQWRVQHGLPAKVAKYAKIPLELITQSHDEHPNCALTCCGFPGRLMPPRRDRLHGFNLAPPHHQSLVK